MKLLYVSIVITTILIFGSFTIDSQEKWDSNKMLEEPSDMDYLRRKMEEQEKMMQEYKSEIENLKEEVQILKKDQKEQREELEREQKEMNEELQELVKETQGEVIREKSLGLLSDLWGNEYLNIYGYAEFEFHDDDRKNSPSRFRLHRITLFFQKSIYDFNFFAEIEFEDAVVIEGDGNNFKTRGEMKVEQAFIEYLYKPWLNLRGGKLLLPIEYNIYHHPFSTYTISSPLISGSIFPEAHIGVEIYGTSEDLLHEDFSVGYLLYVSNGPAPNEGKIDINENKVIGGRVSAYLPRLKTFEQFDLHFNLYYGKNEGKDIDFLWNVEFIMELYNFHLHVEYDMGRRNFHADGVHTRIRYGGFIEAAYTIADEHSIFGRMELLDEDRNSKDRTRKLLVGWRYKPYPEISIKGEFFRESHTNSSVEDFIGVSFSVVIFL